MADVRYQQRVHCTIRSNLEYSSTAIHADMQKVNGDDDLHYGTAAKWVHDLKEGRESIEDDKKIWSTFVSKKRERSCFREEIA